MLAPSCRPEVYQDLLQLPSIVDEIRRDGDERLCYSGFDQLGILDDREGALVIDDPFRECVLQLLVVDRRPFLFKHG
jgi:hypothetical protein